MNDDSFVRHCETCRWSKDGHNAGTEECHLCMWENQYEPRVLTEIPDAAAISIVDTPKGYIMMDGEHHIFFRCKKEAECKGKCNPCSHTLYLIRAENPSFEEDRFEKLYFTDKNDWDWWEKED